jgi:myo-inositol 2-dehydrogenase/D-chiro-inositol 1-dehydrogenase
VSTERTLRAAIVGLRHGHVGRLDPKNPSPGHAHTFKQLPGVRVVAYCEDTDVERLDQARAFDPGAHLYESVDDLIAREPFDLACVCLPANEVPVAGIKLAEAGKHFFVEKQFARTAADLAHLVRAVRRNRVKVLPGYPWRFHPVAQDLRRLIDQGLLGKPLSVESRLVTTQVRPGVRDPGHFLFRDETEGGGILHMLGGHYLEVMRFLMGGEVRAVQAMAGRPVGFIEEPLEDLAIVAMEYENGAFGSIHAGYLLPSRGDSYDSCLIYRGEAGWATWTPVGAPRLEVKSASPEWAAAPARTMEYALAPFAGYGGQRWHFQIMQGFIRDIRVGREPALTVEDALHVFQVIEAAYASARTGRRGEVHYGVEAERRV